MMFFFPSSFVKIYIILPELIKMVEEKELAQVDVDLKMKLKLAEAE